MMKKKTLATLLTLTMLTTAAVPVFAADKTNDTGSTELTYTVESTFTMTIPADTTLTGGTGSSTVSVSDAVIPSGQSLNITVSSANYDTSNSKFRLKDQDKDSNYINYTITKNDNNITGGDSVLTVASGTETGSANLVYKADVTKVAGTYKDTLTFTATVAAPTV